MAAEGLPFILFFTGGAFVLAFVPVPFFRFLGVLFLLAALFCAYFFRDPERRTLPDPSILVSPGDGRVIEVGEEPHPLLEGRARVVKIFLSIFDVHIQRSPLAGTVKAVDYRKGRFLDARDPRASSENEQNAILIENGEVRVVVKQIAGLIARRILCWVQPGQSLSAGERIGLIRFGSQVNIYLPLDARVCVSVGERVEGGVSAVAVLPKPVSSVPGNRIEREVKI